METEQHKLRIKFVIITGAAFAGQNIGSGFATGVEALQFFASWGSAHAFINILMAAVLAISTFAIVYIKGYENQFADAKQVFRYFCGDKFSLFFDYYTYFAMVLIVLCLLSGAGATINQFMGLDPALGTALMCIICIAAALLGLEKLRGVLGYICIFIIAFAIVAGIYTFFTTSETVVSGSANVEKYVASGEVLQASLFGLKKWYLGGLTNAGLLIVSAFAWASAMGGMCRSKKEALCAGIISGSFFYLLTLIVVYLLLVSMDVIAGTEVPLLAIVQRFTPLLAFIYSIIILLAIFSTVSSRLFLVGERFSHGNKKLAFAIIIAITIASVFGSSIIPYSLISNIMFSICGPVGIALAGFVYYSYIKSKREMKMTSWNKPEFTSRDDIDATIKRHSK